MAIDSVNPSLVPGGAGETEIAAFIAGWARDAGLETEVLEATPGRPSVLVRARGTGGGRTLLLCGHIDTVGVEGMSEPHEPRVDGDRLYGRGAYDMKAGVAAALIACREAAALGLAGDVVVAAVADEEHASLGVQEALATLDADAAIVTEPTELELGGRAQGLRLDRDRGHRPRRPRLAPAPRRTTRSSRPGRSSPRSASSTRGSRTRRIRCSGAPSIHASLIEGGAEMSSYPARCLLSVERRTLPGETAADVEREIAALLDGTDATQRTLLVREPFEIAQDDPVVAGVTAAATEALGRPPAIGGASYWADAAFIAAAGIPTVLLRPRR